MISLEPIDGVVWLLLTLGPLLFLQPRLHFEIQALLLALTRKPKWAMTGFAVLFFPGILLHESSHYLMAKLLGVQTRRFSLIPRDLKDGRLQLGFVEVAQADLLRESLIGAAPLLAGGVFVAYTGLAQLELDVLWGSLAAGDAAGLLDALAGLPLSWTYWMWFYLTITVSSTMMPSASDRSAWIPLGALLGLALVVLLWAGAGGWLVRTAGPALNDALRAAAAAFGIAVIVHLAILLPVAVLRRGLGGVLGAGVAR